ncbi:MAG: ThuA domain-containing protein [Verrucomicrobiales bacterium]|nr:ThuA domain-containing protein [Verrucomicrobiales bacterium]
MAGSFLTWAPQQASAEAAKKLLVVTVTTSFRHSSIETAEKVLAQLGADSGAFTVDFVHQPEGQPKSPGRPPEAKPKESPEAFKARQSAYSEALAAFNQAQGEFQEKVRAYMAEQMSMERLKQYDGFIFANTTGNLMLPDPEGFIGLIEGGKAFIAMHSGSDTYHDFRPYSATLGGEFKTHKAQVAVTPTIHDPQHPAVSHLPEGWTVFDEIYIIKTYDPSKTHGLLGLKAHPNEGTPGYYPVSWCKQVGQGRVFYTSLGHREDVWDAEWNPDQRKNDPEIAKQYQQHILKGIQWALGQLEGSAQPNGMPPSAGDEPDAAQ